VLLAALVVALLLQRPELAQLANPVRIQEWIAAAGAWAPLLAIGLMATAIAVTPIRSLPIDLAAGASFGPVLGTLYTATGGLIRGGICFAAARYFGAGFAARFVRGHVLACRRCSDRMLFGVIAAARLLPVVSFDLVSYAAGLTRMSAARFLLAKVLGMLPPIFLLNWLGERAIQDTRLRLVLGAAVGVLIFALPRFVERHDPFGVMRYSWHAVGA
jgi:uncharacterized membrane protein YdjX (TVP38/TMEM64 family)